MKDSWQNNFSYLGKADLHIHSIYSKKCGLASIAEILDYVEKMTDLDVIAITDHDEIDGALEAQKLVKDYSFEVVVGEEVLTREGEIIGLFLKEKIPPRRSLEETLYLIHRQNGLAIIPHPFYFFGKLPGFKKAISRRSLNKILKQSDPNIRVDALEGFNPSWAGFFSHRRLRKFDNRIFKLPLVAGSDAHDVSQIGQAYTLFSGTTAKDLYQSILKGQVLIQTGRFWSPKDNAVLFKNNVKKRLKKYRQRIAHLKGL